MRAKLINEYYFERGIDPREAMGIGIREIRLADYFEPLLKEYINEYGNNLSKKGIIKYWRQFKSQIESLLVGKQVFGEMWKTSSFTRTGITVDKILNTGVKRLFDVDLGESLYVNVIDNRGYKYCLYFHETYKLSIPIKENFAFKRGLEPKEAMGIGQWYNGWRLVQEGTKLTPDELFTLQTHISSWSRKPQDPGDVRSTLEVTDQLGDILEKLPIINFKYTFSKHGSTGLFVYENWPDDFPNYDLFISNVDELEGFTYLVFKRGNPTGYRYARYILQLI